MKRFVILLLLSFSFSGLKAQFAENSDYGIFLGTAYYMGDINQTYHFDHPNISIGGIFRKNLSSRYSVRGTALYSRLSGADADFANPFKQARGVSFSTTAFDLAISGEFNFFSFGEVEGKRKFTPYFTIGIGSTYFLTQEKAYFAPVIPFGAGMKMKLSERVTLNIEWAPRKTFTDDIEGIGQPAFGIDSGFYGKQRFFTSDNDRFYSFGAYLTIKFWKKQHACRAYYGGSKKK